MSEAVDRLFKEISEHLGISVLELRELSTKEPVVQAYYEWKYNWDPKDETTIPF